MLDHGIEILSEPTPLELRFELARADVPLALFQALGRGDVLPFTFWPQCVAVSGGVDLFLADYGQQDGYICFRVNAG